MMWVKWAKVILSAGVLSGLCATGQANTTIADQGVATLPAAAQAPARIALLLPLRSSVFGAAADAVRTGFLTAAERTTGDLAITIVETGDAVQDVLAAYRDATARFDIIVGPLSRSAVTALAQSATLSKPTIALAQPESFGAIGQALPSQMLLMGLSIEDEARQVAAWVEHDKTPGKIFAVSTAIPWQRRALNAFVQQARHLGLTVDSLELSMPNNALSAAGLAQLVQRVQAEQPALLFVALDAAQTMQLRSAIGNDIALYGTSQLNPLTLPGASVDRENKLPELDGVYLVDMPWQLQADHPAVMAYPRAVAPSDATPNADLDRLYALGIDALRVAHEIALQRSSFDIDGVTGQLNVNMAAGVMPFDRQEIQAVFQDGVAIPLSSQR